MDTIKLRKAAQDLASRGIDFSRADLEECIAEGSATVDVHGAVRFDGRAEARIAGALTLPPTPRPGDSHVAKMQYARILEAKLAAQQAKPEPERDTSLVDQLRAVTTWGKL